MAKADLEHIARIEKEKEQHFVCRVFCCGSTACRSSGSEDILSALESIVANRGLSEKIQVVQTGCMGLCSLGPLVRVEITGGSSTLYKEVTPLLARLIMAEHVIPAVVSQDPGAFQPPDFLQSHSFSLELPFFTRQEKVVLRNAGSMNPESIEEYIARGGYSALSSVLHAMSPDDVIESISASGLRGRGGGGYPTGKKLNNTRIASGPQKYVICNGDEGDPGAYMDRSILEGDPHAIIEGLMIAGYTVGADTGWFYIRAEYPLAIQRVEKALRQAKKYGLLGNNILGSDFSFTCEIRLGAGAFVCGEETALIASIEGKRGTPRPKPPYPSDKGLWGAPTCINNVETLANIPPIIRKGAKWFSSMGAGDSKGTKVFALTGKITYSGLIEIPMGMSLRDIVENIGGGTSSGKPVKAVQTGGPSGGVIPERLLDTAVTYEDLERLGSIMGSGGMIIMDVDDSMLDIAAFYLDFTVEESCGKCAPCRIGGKQLLDLLRKVSNGGGTEQDLKLIEKICEAMKHASLCGLGQTAPNPVISTLSYFRNEYEEKIEKEAGGD